ncbi:MAG: OmpA family protein [Opitutaceae bacterium]|nr:OmpA family protein [Cytophagales bacterium]
MLKYILLLFLISFSIQNSFAQADVDAVKLADEMYGFGDKKDALEVYLQAVSLNPKNARANLMVGKCYEESKEKEKSVKYLEKAYLLDPKISPDVHYLIGRGYHFGAQFDKAIQNFNLYKKDLSTSTESNKIDLIKKADKHIAECESGKIFYSKKATKELINLGSVVNTEYEEYAPVISSDESIMIFTSRRQGTTGNKKDRDNEFFEDIYVTKKDKGGKWGAPQNIGTAVNTEFHDATNGLSHDGKELYIYRETHGGDIYKCIHSADGNWSKPERIEHINTKYEEASISFSSDGKLMIFSSDRPGGKGRLDLYFCKQDDKGIWSQPANLSETLNTQYDEDSPFLTEDGKHLYFSSSGHNSMGGYDIFKSTLNGDKWGKPENLGYPINTVDDDIYYVESGDGVHGYYASVRNGGQGEKDIYKITNSVPVEEPIKDTLTAKVEEVVKDTVKVEAKDIKEEIKDEIKATAEPKTLKSVTFKGRVFDGQSGEPIEASIDLLDEKGKLVKSIKTSADGYYTLPLNEKKNRNYSLVVQSVGFVKKSKGISINPSYEETESVQDLALSKYVAGKKYILRNIYFDFNQASITSHSEPELQRLLSMLQKSPNMKIEIDGHTDYVGSAEANKILSQKRAQAVVNYLIKKGISSERLKAVGYGKEHPLASNDDEDEGRELNRRTEFKIL